MMMMIIIIDTYVPDSPGTPMKNGVHESQQDDMLQFYIGFIRPVLEYAVAAWHTG